jgi:large subunit ribosomal protein L22
MKKVLTTAKLKNLRISTRKVRLIIDFVRGMKATEAVLQLKFLKKQAALPVKKLIESAIANAKNNEGVKKEESLIIKSATVDGGQMLHRWAPKAFGRATPIRKRTSHVTIVLEGDAEDKSAHKPKNKENEKISKDKNNL